MVFSLSALWQKDKRLMKASWWDRLTEGETGSCCDGRGHAQWIFNPIFCWWVGMCSLPICSLIFCENSKTATNCWTTMNQKKLEPTKKRYPHPRTKKKPQQDSMRGKTVFRIKPRNHQRWWEGLNKTLCSPGPKDPTRDWARPASECLSVSYGGMGQQWPAAQTGPLAIADLGAQHVA